ncbi:hypothetical protein ACB092_05G263500 [Castanea dentata]
MDTQEDITQYANIFQESFPAIEIVTSNPTKRGGNFNVDEDNLLVSAWLNISIDAVQGTNQRAETFWEKIWQYFCENNTYETTRSASSLQSRWGNIKKKTSRFAGFMAKVEARNKSGGTKEDKLKDAKELYKASPAPTTGKKTAFAFEHCWVVLKNQPKWSMPKERPKGISLTPSSIDQVGSNDDDTMVLERPIGRKAEKAKIKRIDDDKGFEDYLAKILQYIQESHEQYKETLRIKADRVQVDAQRADYLAKKLQYIQESHEQGKEAFHINADRVRMDAQRVDIEKERLHLETIREAQRVDIEKERLRLETIREEGRVMTMDTSGMNEKERLYFENLKDEILARQHLD